MESTKGCKGKIIPGYGRFGICRSKLLPAGLSGYAIKYIVYDSHDVSAKTYCEKDTPTKILRDYFRRNEEPVVTVKKLGPNYYNLYYGSEWSGRQNCESAQ